LGTHVDWLAFCRSVRERLPVIDANNVHEPGYLDPFEFMQVLSRLCNERDIVVPASSGGAFTTAMQAFDQRFGQTVVTDKGLAAMGYGLAGAIGAAFAGGGRRTILCEGDGGFSQNLQELATVAVNALPIKIFLVSNDGYASIRMTQRNYFDGEYLGCDVKSGLGFPNWELLFRAYGIPLVVLTEQWDRDDAILAALRSPGPAAFLVPVDPEQTYFPKITSRVTATGSMESAPLHLMTPPLPADVAADVLRYVEMEQSTIQA
jgi:acetolactate synthase I/II/III large subunit